MQKYIYAQGPRSGALLFLLILISGMFCGCASHSDITRTNQAAQLGVLGRHFRTTVSLTLIYDRPSDTYRLVTRQYDFASVEHRIRRIGELPAGAHLSVKKVVMVDEKNWRPSWFFLSRIGGHARSRIWKTGHTQARMSRLRVSR